MFTGLIEGLATVHVLTPEPAGLRLSLVPPAELSGSSESWCQLGDSIAINGCCLTVVAAFTSLPEVGCLWEFQAGTETLSKTTLGMLAVGNVVNIERSLAVGSRMGGHFVQGHVDGVGRVARIDREGEWVNMTFQLPTALAAQLVPKGSITIDGISLTVVDVVDALPVSEGSDQRVRGTPSHPDDSVGEFRVALIPHTLAVTNLGRKRVGDLVNIETDILGKYVLKMIDAVAAKRAGL